MSLDKAILDVHEHLLTVLHEPSTQLDVRRLEHIDRHVSGPCYTSFVKGDAHPSLVETIDANRRSTLLNQLSEIVPSLQQDPTPVTELIERLTTPKAFSFTNILQIQPCPDFQLGLTVPSPPVNLVTLRLLEKAKYLIGDVNYVAGQKDVVYSLVELWLKSEETAVAHKASETLLGLLLSGDGSKVERIDPIMTQNLMWRRIFRDKDIYQNVFRICSLSTVGEEGQPPRRQKTAAQGRLLDFLLAVRADPVRTPQIPEVEAAFGVKDGGLLEYALVHMIDYKEDDLMLSTLVNFCAIYLRADAISGIDGSSTALQALKRHSLHSFCMSYYLRPSSSYPSWVRRDSATYISTYCSCYRQDFYNDRSLISEILTVLCEHLFSVTKSSWLSGRVPENDLMVISRLPQALLLPHGDRSPVTAIPPVNTDVQVLNTLSEIFSISATQDPQDQAASRALFFLYLDEYPDFWDKVTKAAETVALLELALAANGVIGYIIDASWQPLPDIPSLEQFALPTEEWLSRQVNYGEPLPQSGIEAILSAHAASVVLPYLMKPATTFGNLVGGGRGDVESAAWKVAVAKHDILIKFRDNLKIMGGTSDLQDMITAINQRIAQGPMGKSTQAGGHVGTLEL